MNIAVIGLGLIGASMAKSIKRFTHDTVYGYDLSEETLSAALADKAIDDTAHNENLATCDYVFVALYPQATVDFIREKSNVFKRGAIIIDCCGIKKKITDAVDELSDNIHWNFIGGHPMAGKEVSGYANSEASLWKNAYFIMTPCKASTESALTAAQAYIKKLGFIGITVTTPEQHDRVIAYTSQLPHVLACAYIFNPISREHCGFSAGSYKDVSRVALINEELWTELFLDNSNALCNEIDCLIRDLDSLKNLIENKQREDLKAKLRTGRLIKTETDR